METVKAKKSHNRQGLILKFQEVPSAGLEYALSNSSGELNSVLFDIMGDFPVYEAVIKVEPNDAMIQVKGDVGAELRLTCSRCAEEFNSKFNKNFVTAFYKSEHSLKNFSWDADDLEGSFDLEFLEGETIDLGEVVHEQIAIEIPFKPLCTEDCLGLCSQCGTNLNQKTCGCKPIQIDKEVKKSPFEKLKILRGE